MRRKYPKYKRMTLGLVVGIASAATIAPATQASGTNGPLDPWAYALVHRSTAAAVVPAGGKDGPLDPWAYALVHRSTEPVKAVASNSVPQDVRDHRLVGELVRADRLASQSGFNWGDAGIGALVSFGAVLFLLTSVGLGRRYRSRIRRSGLAVS
jgi:hypothetical protein